jgi:hypothetical protein
MRKAALRLLRDELSPAAYALSGVPARSEAATDTFMEATA